MKIVITSGYFDPLHIGHLEYLRLAKKLGDKLIVIINTDRQAVMKKGFSFMNEMERADIIESLRFVDKVIMCIDRDTSVCETIKKIFKEYKNCEIIFAKGGDRFSFEVPEAKICKELGIKIVDGLGLKIRSSSELIENARKL